MVLSPTAGPTIFTILLMILVKVKEKNLSTLFTVVNSPLGEPPNTVNNKLLLNIITYEEVSVMSKKTYTPPCILSRIDVESTMGMGCPGHLSSQQISCKC